MNLGQDLTALEGESRSDLVEVGGANDSRAQGVPFEPLHHEAVAKAVVFGEGHEDFRFGYAGCSGDLHQFRFYREARTVLGAAVLAACCPPHCKESLGAVDHGR